MANPKSSFRLVRDVSGIGVAAAVRQARNNPEEEANPEDEAKPLTLSEQALLSSLRKDLGTGKAKARAQPAKRARPTAPIDWRVAVPEDDHEPAPIEPGVGAPRGWCR